MLAPGARYPIERAPARYVWALDPRADHVGFERRFLPIEAGEVADQRGNRVVEQRHVYCHASLRLLFLTAWAPPSVSDLSGHPHSYCVPFRYFPGERFRCPGLHECSVCDPADFSSPTLPLLSFPCLYPVSFTLLDKYKHETLHSTPEIRTGGLGIWGSNDERRLYVSQAQICRDASSTKRKIHALSSRA